MKEVRVEVVRGASGLCLSVNDKRVAGPKPWGSGTVVASWTVSWSDLVKAVRGR